MKKILITTDLFDIVKRLKAIDEKYFILFNKQTNKFEVHYSRNHDTLEIVLPYSKLDKRTVDLVLKTKIENRKKLIEQMELNNQKIEDENNKKIIDEMKYKSKEMIEFLNNNTNEIDLENLYKNKWE